MSWASERFQFRVPKVTNFKLLHTEQTGSRIIPASFPMGIEGSFPGDKRREEREAVHSSQLRAEVEKRGSIHLRPQYVFRRVVLH
jgi:hypothetical protein